MICKISDHSHKNNNAHRHRACITALMLISSLALFGCGHKEKASGQSLVKVNGEEITVHQLNEELGRSGVPQAQQDAASKQLLEALIDRQLLKGEAIHDKIDRDPAVMNAIERAKAQIIAQAYLQKRFANLAKPGKTEIDTYYSAHPEIFSKRREYAMSQVTFSAKEYGAEMKAALESAKSLPEVVKYLQDHSVNYIPGKLARSSAELPPDLVAKMNGMAKGQIFVVKEGERGMAVSLDDFRDAPVSLDAASPQIAQILLNKRNKDAAESEVARLRASAKIEYLNKSLASADSDAKPKIEKAAADKASGSDGSHIDAGVAGLK